MAEKRTRRVSLSPLLHTIRDRFKKCIGRRCRRQPSPPPAPEMQNRSASMPPKNDFVIIKHNPNVPCSSRNFSAPQHQCTLFASDRTDQLQGNNESNQRTPRVPKVLRIRRLTARLSPRDSSSPRSQTTTSSTLRPSLAPSRLPTPTEPPRGELYSHSVYQREGRRSVLSSLGRRYTITRRETANIESMLDDKTRGLTTRDMQLSSHGTHRPVTVLRGQLQCNVEYSNGFTVKKILSPSPTLVPVLLRQEQAPTSESSGSGSSSSSNQTLVPRYHRDDSSRSSSESLAGKAIHTTMEQPRRVRLTRGFDNLKTHQPQQTRLPLAKQKLDPSLDSAANAQNTQSQLQTQEHAKENAPTVYNTHIQPRNLPQQYTKADLEDLRSAKRSPSRIPLANSGNIGRKIQHEKMVSRPLVASTDLCHHTPRPSQIPNRFLNRERPRLTANAISRPQVETAMPRGYWLGRFVTLTNAFHYEDSFNAPDIATGFEIPSSYSRPFQGSDDADLSGYRVKRAFMVLENLCATEEASESLHDFREAYIERFGDRWMT
ncbi:hypothetical protein BJX61DRAFT_541215 [Aspergillus egyptiacus]|nr:hypothetical protein BJX61DRAFT_541215 [Aspergillus egyptiacus]